MNKPTPLKALMAGSAMTLAFAVPASAQTLNVDIAELEGKSAECRSLGQFIAARNGNITGVEPTQVADAVNNDVAEECAEIQTLLTAQAGTAQDGLAQDSETAQAGGATTESVETSQEATIVGQAVVRVPEPNVDVRVPRPEVTVRQVAPRVTVQDGAPQIEVEQAQPEIAVEIPTINVRVTMPAPSIYVLQGDPQVSVAAADPQVEVVQGEPEVIVTQPDPELNIDLGLAEGQQAPVEGQAQDSAGTDGAQQVSGNVDLAQQEPIISFVPAAEEPQVEVTRAEPEISFSGATEPQVTVTLTEQPTVDVQMAGEPQVVIETPEEREQRRASQQSAAANAPAGTPGQANAVPAATAAGAGGQVTVGDLRGMAVMTADGENLGSPEGVIDLEGQQYLLVSSGGFMGLGDKIVPVPLTAVSMEGDRLMLDTMTEQDIERARDYDHDQTAGLADDQPVTIAN